MSSDLTRAELHDVIKTWIPPGLDPDQVLGGVSASLASFDTAQDAVSMSRAQIGARVNRLDALKQRQDGVSLNLTGLLSNVKDVDMAKAITNFTMAQTVYNASLKASAQMMQTSLLDYLR